MTLLPDQLYLTYQFKLGDTTFRPTIGVENLDQADTLRAVKLNHAIPGMEYQNFKVIKGPDKKVIKDYNHTDRARWFIDTVFLKDQELTTTQQ